MALVLTLRAHRKSENVLLQLSIDVLRSGRHGSGVQRACLGDFGEAKRMADRRLTMNVGTPEFMAPEVIRGTRQGSSTAYDVSSDVWSFGQLMFEALTGDIPYRSEGMPPFKLAAHVQSGTRPVLSNDSVVCDSLLMLRTIMLSCTEFTPENRPTAQELLAVFADMVQTLEDEIAST